VFSGSSDPSFGDFTQRLAVHSDRGVEYTYTLKALNASGDGQALVEKKISLKPAERSELKIETALNAASAQRLLFQLDGPGGELLMRQLVPFRLSEDYLDVTPVFGAGQVLVKPRYTMLKAKDASLVPAVRLLGPDGRVIRQLPISSDAQQSLAFDRKGPAGAYVAELISGEGDATKVYTSKKFQYTGQAPWENLPPPGTVPAPFTALTSKRTGRQVEIGIWGRKYRFDGSLLPTSIQTQGKELLSAPAQFSIGGVPVTPESSALKGASPMRADLAARRKTADYALTQEAWVEYDGVFFNRLQVKATRDLGAVTLSLPLPEAYAKFMHATASGFGGGGRQNLWLDRNQELPFYPSVWVGNEESGLAWFAESTEGWSTRDARPIKVVRDGKTTRLEITFADKVPAGSEFAPDFGLSATPGKPLPGDLPPPLRTTLSPPAPAGANLTLTSSNPALALLGSAGNPGTGSVSAPLSEGSTEVSTFVKALAGSGSVTITASVPG